MTLRSDTDRCDVVERGRERGVPNRERGTFRYPFPFLGGSWHVAAMFPGKYAVNYALTFGPDGETFVVVLAIVCALFVTFAVSSSYLSLCWFLRLSRVMTPARSRTLWGLLPAGTALV